MTLADLAAQALADRLQLEDAEAETARQEFISAAVAFVSASWGVTLNVEHVEPGVLVVLGDGSASVAVRPAGDTWQLTAVRLVDDGWTDLGAIGSLADLGALLKADQ